MRPANACLSARDRPFAKVNGDEVIGHAENGMDMNQYSAELNIRWVSFELFKQWSAYGRFVGILLEVFIALYLSLRIVWAT